MRLLCARLRRTTAQVEDLALRSLESRLARVLLAFAEYEQSDSIEIPRQITLTMSQRELGEVTGATRESVNKTFRLWRDLGIAELQDKKFVINDLDTFKGLTDSL